VTRKSLSFQAALILALATGPAFAADAGTGTTKPLPTKDAGAATKDASAAATPGPAPGMPPGDEDDDPHADGNPHAGGNPHGSQGGTRPDGLFEPPPDTSTEDPSLPAGTIVATIQDADGKPVPRASLTLGILRNSVAKGESRERIAKTTDEQGTARFDGLESGSGIAYRVTSSLDGATFAVMPFQLGAKMGTRAVLHIYPVETSVDKTMAVSQAIIFAELKDDRIQLQQAISVFNFGKVAWVPPPTTIMTMPTGFTALSSQQGMSDVGIDALEKQGARIRGTFGPGRNDFEFRWQMPYSGDREVTLEVPLPPHTAAIRVITPSGRDMKVEVEGFGPGVPRTDAQGGRALIFEKQLRRDETQTKVKIFLRDLPTPGPGRVIAAALAALAVVLGVAVGRRQKLSTELSPAERESIRKSLLEELEDMERALKNGDLGPKTYERARRDLIDRLAATFVGAT